MTKPSNGGEKDRLFGGVENNTRSYIRSYVEILLQELQPTWPSAMDSQPCIESSLLVYIGRSTLNIVLLHMLYVIVRS